MSQKRNMSHVLSQHPSHKGEYVLFIYIYNIHKCVFSSTVYHRLIFIFMCFRK